jgi:hypothetical protein
VVEGKPITCTGTVSNAQVELVSSGYILSQRVNAVPDSGVGGTRGSRRQSSIGMGCRSGVTRTHRAATCAALIIYQL